MKKKKLNINNSKLKKKKNTTLYRESALETKEVWFRSTRSLTRKFVKYEIEYKTDELDYH